MNPTTNGGFPITQAHCVMETLTLHADNDTSEDWPSQNNAEEGTKGGLVVLFCSLVSIGLQRPSLLWSEWILSWVWGPPRMTSVRAQMTGQIVCADTAVKEPFVVAGSTTRVRGDTSEKSWPAAKANKADEWQRRALDLHAPRFSFCKVGLHKQLPKECCSSKIILEKRRWKMPLGERLHSELKAQTGFELQGSL